eukprot:7522897-Pyramimonas_sp.AAC.1
MMELESRAGGGLVRTPGGTLLLTTAPQSQGGRHMASAAAPAGARLADQLGVGVAVLVEVEPDKVNHEQVRMTKNDITRHILSPM